MTRLILAEYLANIRRLASEIEALTASSRVHDGLAWIELDDGAVLMILKASGRTYKDLAPDYTSDATRRAEAARQLRERADRWETAFLSTTCTAGGSEDEAVHSP